MRNGAVASVVAATISAGGAFGGYMYFRPKDLKGYLEWKGYELAKHNDDALWKAIYQDNKGDFMREISSQAKSDEWKVIRDYCKNAFKKNDYSSEVNKAIKWCLDDVKTVGGQLVRDGEDLGKLMQNEKQFQVATAVQGNDKFWALLEATDKDFEGKTESYQKWCKDSLDEAQKKNLVENVKRFCRPKKYSDFKQKLESDGYVRVQKQDMSKKYNEDFKGKKIKQLSDSNFLSIIAGENFELEKVFNKGEEIRMVSEKDFVELYEKYCKKEDGKTFENNNYEQFYSNYRGICATKKEEQRV